MIGRVTRNTATSQLFSLSAFEQPHATVDCLLDLNPGVTARGLGALDWNLEDARSEEHTHALHPYPAKFIPQLPRQAIAALSRPDDLVLDPFCGGGTTAVEATVAGRRFYGIDANAVGIAIGRAKTSPLTGGDAHALTSLEATLLSLRRGDLLEGRPSWLPQIPNLSKWYDADVFRALGLARELVMQIEPDAARELALVSFVQAATRLSFQESETRYTSRPRPVDVLEVPRMFLRELRRMRRIAEEASGLGSRDVRFVVGDARDPVCFDLEPESAGLIVTSPPYPNTYDYHLYHRFRLFWLGCDPSELRQVEIGSHLKNQSKANPADAYLTDLQAVLENCLPLLPPGRFAVLVVGDGLFKGEVFETARHIERIAGDVGFEHVVTLDRLLPSHRRSVTKPGRRLTSEQLVFIRRPAAPRYARVLNPNYKLFPYESELLLRELRALRGSPRVRNDGAIEVIPNADIERAAFAHGFELHDGRTQSTLQRRAEGMPATTSRRKNSTYFAHGIHRYKGKFYPQLAKSLLNLSGLEPGRSLVVDPFGGSGTVALEAVLNGLDALSIDCNPVATAIARAKVSLASASPRRVEACIERVRLQVAGAPATGSAELTQFTPATLPELQRWFPEPALRKLDWLLGAIREEADERFVGFLEVLVSDIIREVSQQEPKDLRVRRRRVPISDAPVYELFLGRLDESFERLVAFWRHASSEDPRLGSAEVVLGTSSDPTVFRRLGGRRIHAIVSSPPYAAALPYVDTDRLSLAALFGYSSAERKAIEELMIGSREITERERASYESRLKRGEADVLPESTLTFLSDYRNAVAADAHAGFRLRQAPAVLLRYFHSMSAVLANLRDHVADGALCWLVLGDSRSTVSGRRWTIPTVDEVASIAEHRRFRVVDRIPITVTREDVLHSRHAITRNEILQLSA
jgi:DNA modification methylase